MDVGGRPVLANLLGGGDPDHAAVIVGPVLAVPELVEALHGGYLVEVVDRCGVGGEPLQAAGVPRVGADRRAAPGPPGR